MKINGCGTKETKATHQFAAFAGIAESESIDPPHALRKHYENIAT